MINSQTDQRPPYMFAKVKRATSCAVCSKTLSSPVIEFPDFPLAGLLFKNRKECVDFRFDLGVCICPKCGHAQLHNQVDPNIAYGKGFIFKSSDSPGQLSGIANFFSFVMQHLNGRRQGTIIEIGCNDLRLLRRFTGYADHLIGIDPILVPQDDSGCGNKITLIGKYIEDVNLKEVFACKAPDVILCRHTLEHIPNPRKIIEKLVEIATPKTLFVVEIPIFEEIVRNLRYNQIFHEHLHYWTLESFEYLLKNLGCCIKRISMNGWGAWASLMISFQIDNRTTASEKSTASFYRVSAEEVRKGFDFFKEQLGVVKKCMNMLIGRKMCGYGAAVVPPILAYHMGTDFGFLEVIWDDDRGKDGLWYPNLPVQIKCPPENLSLKEYCVVITEPDAAFPILTRLKHFEAQQVIIPRITL